MAYIGLSLTLITVVTIGQVYSQCSTGWLHHDESCYLLYSKDKYNWIESEMVCAGHNAHLAYVDDKAENTFIKGLIMQDITESGASVWIGASDDIVEGQFLWYGNDQPVTFTDWGPGEPNSIPLHLDEDCLAYWGDYKWKWADYDCHQPTYFICEKSMEENSVIVG